MYPKRKWNVLILAISVASLGAFWFAIRQQWAISDRQFLRSMIPHHAGAILMCHEAPIEDPEVRQLCRGIIASQQAEIGQMKAKLETLEGR
jgi:uncharacterized protein (DUF305 family)